MLKDLLPAIMKLFAYLLVLHLGIDNMLLPLPKGIFCRPIRRDKGMQLV